MAHTITIELRGTRTIRISLSRAFFLTLYYGFARYLPSYDKPYGGKLSKKIRYACCKRIFDKCGKGVHVDRGVDFATGAGIEIGDHSTFGANSRIGVVKIGNGVFMGPEVMIITKDHVYSDLTIPIWMQGATPPEPVIIEDDVWVGARVIILPGRRIGRGSVIGAGAVITKDVPPYAVVGGNPARVLKYRTSQAHLEPEGVSQGERRDPRDQT